MERDRPCAVLTGVAVLLACGACGCGATTLRITAAPALDTTGAAGFESMVSLGFGWPLDFKGRSNHFVQARATLGGGTFGPSTRGVVIAGGELDYIHWAEPSFDVRAGLHALYRRLPDGLDPAEQHAFGIHLGVFPAVLQDDGSWLVSQLLIGPELRIEYLGSSGPTGPLGHFSVPLVIEANLLAAGD